MVLNAILFSSSLVLLAIISSTTTASKPDMVVLEGHDDYKPPASKVNVADEVVSVNQRTVSFGKVKLHTSAKIDEKEKAFQKKKSTILTPSIETNHLEKRMGRTIIEHIKGTARAIRGVAGKLRAKQAGTGKNNRKLDTNVRTNAGNEGGRKTVKGSKNNLKTKVRTSNGKVKRTRPDKKSSNLNGSVRTSETSVKLNGDRPATKVNLRTKVRKSAGGTKAMDTNVDKKSKASVRVARPLKTSVRTEDEETLTHREMHYEYTSVYPPTCPCMIGKGLTPSECWYYTDDTRTKCKSRQCKQSWVCVVGETTGFTCMRKKSFYKVVPDGDDETCTTKEHIAYSYVPYT